MPPRLASTLARSSHLSAPAQAGHGACEQVERLIAAPHIAAQHGPLQLGAITQRLGSEPLDDVEVTERLGLTTAGRQRTGQPEMRVGLELVVVAPLCRRDRVGEGLLGQVDLTQHPPSAPEDCLGATQGVPILGVAGHVTQHPNVVSYPRGVTFDRGGQLGQQIHGITVDLRQWS